MKLKFILFSLVFAIALAGRAEDSPTAPPEIARTFMRHLEKSEVDQAIQLWSGKVLNQRLKDRIRKMSEKIVKSGGLKKLETPPVEKRRRNLDAHEVALIVVYNDKNLAFGSMSFVEENGQFKISNLRSEVAWGGTTSLFDEVAARTTDEKDETP